MNILKPISLAVLSIGLWSCSGSDGVSTLIDTTQEPAGQNCSLGGLKVTTGPDTNGDKRLSGSEIESVNYLCSQRVDGFDSLVDLENIPEGNSLCKEGGVEVFSGTDVNNNGVLEKSERNPSSAKICSGLPGTDGTDGTNGQTSLAKLRDIPLGDASCQFGGTEIIVGLDKNGNGKLDSAEEDFSQKICSVRVNDNMTLVKTSVITAGTQGCEYGGVLTQVGIDDSNDRVLQNSEVDSQTKQCNEVQIVDGKTSLVRVAPATANQCAFGGHVIYTGIDDNRDGTLTTNEVDSAPAVVCNGNDGLAGLVEPSDYDGDRCSIEGGVRYESGLDLNSNGTLESNEVQSVSYICNGEDGTDGIIGYDGLNSLVETTDDGGACGGYGGIYVRSGLDANDNGVLDSDEIDGLDLICNGADGYNTLVTAEEDTGFNCGIDGGVVFKSGRDLDEDGVLDFDEVEYESAACFPPAVGALLSGPRASGLSTKSATDLAQHMTAIVK